ncbi:anti-sigma factor domain-containing protein [Dehalobacterium formicoaceticum]|uniref:Anti-sigma factor domain-containing protein n=1 Tax=Dehalobacterium formicoaceticum TaxID=51515 RepID=A0ABT1Y4H2_9FIRM|nr:anti-sigma factor domain-containing protein [Dehalobacterium formicoaceticum]MCR6545777.1 anti-sigma factor domain-containing protein [Dehalobacterium formicoaceticum]
MKKKQLIIMSIDKNYTVGYTEDGQFVKIPQKPAHQVGQMINYQPTKFGSRYHRGLAVAAAILLVFFAGIFSPFFQQEAAASYLSIGLNTGSLEIWTDHNNKVIETLYTDSLERLNQLELKGKDIYEAVAALTVEAKKCGLITEKKDDILLVNLIDIKEDSQHHVSEDKIKKIILEELNAKEYKGLMMMERHDKDYLTKANELNLTASQYQVYEKSSAKGHKLEMEKIKHGQIRSVLEEAGTTPEEIFEMPNNNMHNNTMNNTMHNNNHGMSAPIPTPNQNNETIAPEQSKDTMQEQEQEQDVESNNHMGKKSMQMDNYNKMHN